MRSTKQSDRSKGESLEDSFTHILEEARMVLPGVQTFLGFQLIAVFNEPFLDMSTIDRNLHIAAVCLSINAICFLLTPAAMHRQNHKEEITPDFARSASNFIRLGMFPLLLSVVIDAYVVIHKATQSGFASVAIATLLAAELLFCWFILPHIRQDSG